MILPICLSNKNTSFFFKSTIKTSKKQEAKPQGRQRNIWHSCESAGLSFGY